jgi:hypothetical protein
MAEPKKETVRIALPPKADQAATLQNAPKRDTTRIVLPSRTPPGPVRRPPTFTPSPSTVPPTAEPPVISLRRPPVSPPAISTSPLLQPLPKPAGPATNPEARATPPASDGNGNAPAIQSASSLQPGPKKETARIRILPRPAATGPSVNMTKTQPLLVRPATTTMQPAPVVLTSRPLDPFELIPRKFCWTLLGISAVIFLIQIWNYVVS